MTVDMDDLPVVETLGSLGRRPGTDSAVADAYSTVRRDDHPFLSSLAFSLGTSVVGLLHDRVFPSPMRLRAAGAQAQGLWWHGGAPHAGPSYSTYGDCGPYHYNGVCEEACFGFAAHHMDPFYCATCAEQQADPVNNPAWNWHFVGSRGQFLYMDREPDVCAGKDAWKWKVEGPCGNCQTSSIFRCHDGYKKYPDSEVWDPTICQGLISCDDRLTTC